MPREVTGGEISKVRNSNIGNGGGEGKPRPPNSKSYSVYILQEQGPLGGNLCPQEEIYCSAEYKQSADPRAILRAHPHGAKADVELHQLLHPTAETTVNFLTIFNVLAKLEAGHAPLPPLPEDGPLN